MAGHERWQLDASTPELYERYLVPAITSIWAADLLDRIPLRSNETVLDIACGTGAVIRLAARQAQGGRLVGIDLNPAMLAVARSMPPTGTPIEWVEGSALDLPFPVKSFDVVLCQLGLQFFPDRPLALREMLRVLRPSGRVGLSVYSAIERTPAAHAFVQALDKHLGPGASKTKRAEHIFPDPEEVKSLLEEAGFNNVDVTTVTKQINFPSMLDYVRFQLIATPMAALLKDKISAERDQAILSMAADAASRIDSTMIQNGKLSFPQESHVAMPRLERRKTASSKDAGVSACLNSNGRVMGPCVRRDDANSENPALAGTTAGIGINPQDDSILKVVLHGLPCHRLQELRRRLIDPRKVEVADR